MTLNRLYDVFGILMPSFCLTRCKFNFYLSLLFSVLRLLLHISSYAHLKAFEGISNVTHAHDIQQSHIEHYQKTKRYFC